MEKQVEFNGSEYVLLGEDWYDRRTFIKPPQVIAAELDRLYSDSAKSQAPELSIAGDQGEHSFSQEETFPLIANAIRQAFVFHGEYVPHEMIVDELLKDPAARGMILAARRVQESDTSDRGVAANMVAWFSQRITVGTNPFAADFRRKKIDGKWAYRPLET